MKTLTFKNHLSETGLMDTIDFTSDFKIMIDCPTGGGKTHYIVNYLKDNNIPFVFLSDTLLLMNQIGTDYGVDSYSAKNRENYKSKQLITVYNHINKFWKNKVIVVDEAHSLVTDYGFKRDIIEEVLRFVGEAKQVILLSGTPLITKDEAYNDLKIIKCVKETPKTYDINMHRIEEVVSKLEYTVKLAGDIKAKGLVPVISLLDTNKKLNDLIDLLKSNGFDNVGMINSVTKDNNNEMDIDCTHYKELVETGTISADVIITTYVQGYNINNTNCSLIIVPSSNKHSYISIVQMVARFRKMDDMEIHLVGNEVILPDGALPSHWSNFYIMKDNIEKTIEASVLHEIAQTKKIYKTERGLRHFFETESEFQYLINSTLQINKQMIALDVVNKITNEMYKDITTANTILNQYNIIIKQVKQLTTTTMNKEELKTLDYETAVDLYFNYLEVGGFYATTLGYKIHKKYLELLELGLNLEQIKTILKESAGNEKAYNRVVNGYRFRKSNTLQFANIRKDILTAFKKGDCLTSDKIFEVVSKTVTANGGVCESKVKATEILNFLFETEEKSKRNSEGKVTRTITIKLVK